MLVLVVLFAGEVRGFGKTVIVEHKIQWRLCLGEFMTRRLKRLDKVQSWDAPEISPGNVSRALL